MGNYRKIKKLNGKIVENHEKSHKIIGSHVTRGPFQATMSHVQTFCDWAITTMYFHAVNFSKGDHKIIFISKNI